MAGIALEIQERVVFLRRHLAVARGPALGLAGFARKIPAAPQSGEVVLYLAAGDAGDGRDGDIVVWRQPRLETPGRPPLLLRDVRPLGRYLAARRREILAATSRYLVAAAEAPPGCDRETIVGSWPGRMASRPMPWPRGSITLGSPGRVP